VLIVAQVAITVAVLPSTLLRAWEIVRETNRAQEFAPDEYLATRFTIESDAGAPATASPNATAAMDSTNAIVRRFMAQLASEPGVVGATVATGAPWEGETATLEADGAVTEARRATTMAVDTGFYHLTMPGERSDALLTIRLSGRTPETFMPTLRRLAMSADPTLQLTKMSALDAMYRDYARSGAQLVLVVVIVTGVVILLSAAGIHALMSFAVNQRRREIGIRAALGAPARRILKSVLSRATRQLVLGLGIGVGIAIAIDRASGGSLMSGAGLLFVPSTVALMLVVGLIAAAGPARRGLRVQPTEALRSE
jgi:putative effector of murein hydrolase LrgA (UPF0299 family)